MMVIGWFYWILLLSSKFLWRGLSQPCKKLHLISWSQACRPKDQGGLGVLDLKVHESGSYDETVLTSGQKS